MTAGDFEIGWLFEKTTYLMSHEDYYSNSYNGLRCKKFNGHNSAPYGKRWSE